MRSYKVQTKILVQFNEETIVSAQNMREAKALVQLSISRSGRYRFKNQTNLTLIFKVTPRFNLGKTKKIAAPKNRA